jgi:L-aminopeptidase/D-esterase-like protein
MSADLSQLGMRLSPGPNNSLIDVPGIEVGHFTHDRVPRGITAILCKEGADAGVSVRGGNPGTLNTDALGPLMDSALVHGIGLTGGSLLGLTAITGITEWLLTNGYGVKWHGVTLPIVSGAVIYDLLLSDYMVRPTVEWGMRAAAAASSAPFARGNVGAGAGGTAGKGPGCVPTKGGLGTASLQLPGGIVVAALVVINSLGGHLHPTDGRTYASEGGFEDPLLYHRVALAPEEVQTPMNTTLGVIATNAALEKNQLVKVADLAHNGLARALRPMHTMLDGDTIFAMTPLADQKTLPNTYPGAMTDLVGSAAADAMVLACLDAAQETTGLPGWPSVAEARAKLRSQPD